MTPPFVEWKGDWNKRQPARLGGATLYLFPLPVDDPSKLAAACKQRFEDPSGGQVTVEPLGPMVLLVCVDFQRISSLDPAHALEGYIREHDVGIFVPVRTTVDGVPRGIGVFIPYLYVDNAAAVIMGREIFGFPKLMSSIRFEPGPLEFQVDSLTFAHHDPGELAEDRRILGVRRGPFFPLGSWVPAWLASLFSSSQSVSTVEALANLVLESVGLEGALGPLVTDFASVDFVFLKQTRSAATPLEADLQSIVLAPGSISSFSSVQMLLQPLFWPAIVEFDSYDSVDIAATLGLAPSQKVRTVFRVECDLDIDVGEVLWNA